MLSWSIFTVVLVLCLDYTQSFYSGGYGGGPLRAPMCSEPSKPCRLNVILGNFGGPVLQSNSAEVCTCSPPYTCSDDWDTPGHVVSRKVVSTSHNITLRMMFCNRVEPKRYCSRRDGDIALIVKGSLAMPQDIDAYNCRCRRGHPLVLYERSRGDDHLFYHKYICANHMRRCARRAACMTISSVKTNYHCKCRQGLQCHVNSAPWGSDATGSCRQ